VLRDGGHAAVEVGHLVDAGGAAGEGREVQLR
jgi:hypothetical protein